jgi:hypothetical protein
MRYTQKYWLETLIYGLYSNRIWGSHCCEYEDYSFLRYDGVPSGIQRRFGGTYCLHLHGR